MPLDRSALRQAVRFALIATALIATGCDSSTPVAPTAQSTNAPDPLRAPLERLGMQGIARGDLAKAEIQRALQQLATTPCNSQAMGALAPQLKAMGYRKEAAQALITFADECGNADGFLLSAVGDLLMIRDYPQAIAISNRLIADHPTDTRMRYTRAQAYSQTRQYEQALADYLEVIALSPNPRRLASGVFTETAQAQAKLGRHCEAASTVRMWMSLDPSRTQNPQGKRLVAEYERQRDCPASYASGKDTFPRKPDQVILASVEVNGKKGTFIVDTGASVVAITRAFAERAGIDYLGGRKIAVQTANGHTDVHTGMAKRIQIRQVAANQVPVVVQAGAESAFGPGVDGLLGQSFLSRFDTHFGPRQWSIAVPATDG
ncbi:retroviral-like aspartic protease family protein [Achromobacter xylosoxidans]|nr:retroviral-like aspartic protease family protein [Achromobacter xylosoxidans]